MREPKHTSDTSLCPLTLWGTGKRKLQSCVEEHRMVKADHRFFFLPLSLSFALTLWAAALRLITHSLPGITSALLLIQKQWVDLCTVDPTGTTSVWFHLFMLVNFDFMLKVWQKAFNKIFVGFFFPVFFFCWTCPLSTCESTEHFGRREKIVS